MKGGAGNSFSVAVTGAVVATVDTTLGAGEPRLALSLRGGYGPPGGAVAGIPGIGAGEPRVLRGGGTCSGFVKSLILPGPVPGRA